MNSNENRFSELDDINKSFISRSIMTAITLGKCSPDILKENLSDIPEYEGMLTDDIYQQMIVLLSNMGIIEPLNVIHENTDAFDCIIHCWNNIADDIKELLINTGHTEEEIRKLLNELPDDQKEIISRIINDTDPDIHWNEVSEMLPPDDVIVVIRIYNPTIVAQENDRQKLLVEDISVAKWTGSEWNIVGPYPCIDYSPLVQRDKINKENGAIVSHWREINPDELDSWIHRYDAIRDYGYLDVFVDDENKEIVYRALVHGSNVLDKLSKDPNNDEQINAGIKELSNVLNDMAGCLDREEGVYLEPKLALHKLDDVRKKVVNLMFDDSDTDESEDN